MDQIFPILASVRSLQQELIRLLQGALPQNQRCRLLQGYVENLSNIENTKTIKPVHDISNNVVCATSNASDQPAHTYSMIRGFASRLSIL